MFSFLSLHNISFQEHVGSHHQLAYAILSTCQTKPLPRADGDGGDESQKGFAVGVQALETCFLSHAGGVVPYTTASVFIGVPENRLHIERDRLLVGELGVADLLIR